MENIIISSYNIIYNCSELISVYIYSTSIVTYTLCIIIYSVKIIRYISNYKLM